MTLQPGQAATYTPSADAAPPEGYSGSVQVVAQGPGVPPPVVVAEVDGGSAYGQHGPPTCAVPPASTPTATVPPASTPTTTATPKAPPVPLTPTQTPDPKPKRTTIYLPLVTN